MLIPSGIKRIANAHIIKIKETYRPANRIIDISKKRKNVQPFRIERMKTKGPYLAVDRNSPNGGPLYDWVNYRMSLIETSSVTFSKATLKRSPAGSVHCDAMQYTAKSTPTTLQHGILHILFIKNLFFHPIIIKTTDTQSQPKMGPLPLKWN